MKTHVMKSGLLIAVVACPLAAFTAAAQTASPPAASTAAKPAASPQQLAGQWRLNKELSTLPKAPQDQPGQGQDGGRSGGRSGGSSGGYGGRRGGGMGGFGGGMMGRRGGGGGGDDEDGSRVSNDTRLKMLELRRVLSEPADVLTIVVSPSDVSMTDEHGTVRRFKTDDRKEQIDFGPGARADVKTRWDGGSLSQEFTAGPMKATERYQITMEGRLLAITIETSGQGARDQSTPIKYVYERP